MAEMSCSRLGATVLWVWFVAVGGWSSKSIVVAAADPPLPDCKSVLVSLQGCTDFVTGIAASPSAECCSGVTDVHMTDPQCLCVLALNDTTTSIIPNYRLDLAGQLPTLCKIQGASVNNCPALLGETNVTTPAAPPGAVASAPTSPDHGGAYKLTTSANLRAFVCTYVGIILAASALISHLTVSGLGT